MPTFTTGAGYDIINIGRISFGWRKTGKRAHHMDFRGDNMRLWHQKLIPYLSDNHIKGQHRECCALRGKGWGRKHSTVDYVFTHSRMELFAYHMLIMYEIKERCLEYTVGQEWTDPHYCGKSLPMDYSYDHHNYGLILGRPVIYREHDDEYLKECIRNLYSKGFSIKFSTPHLQ